jgi:hypothetical protein
VWEIVILGAGFLHLRTREKALNITIPSGISFRPSQAHGFPRLVLFLLLLLYITANGAILILNVLPPYQAADGASSAFPGQALFTITFGIVFFGFVYYLLVFGAAVWDMEGRRGFGGGADGVMWWAGGLVRRWWWLRMRSIWLI